MECNVNGIGPLKLKFLLRFDQSVEYKRSAGAYPGAIFTKFAEFVPRFAGTINFDVNIVALVATKPLPQFSHWTVLPYFLQDFVRWLCNVLCVIMPP